MNKLYALLTALAGFFRGRADDKDKQKAEERAAAEKRDADLGAAVSAAEGKKT